MEASEKIIEADGSGNGMDSELLPSMSNARASCREGVVWINHELAKAKEPMCEQNPRR